MSASKITRVALLMALATVTTLPSLVARGQAPISVDDQSPSWYREMIGPDQVPDDGSKVVGGEVAKPGAWPWQVAIYRRAVKDGQPVGALFCGGSLIDAKWVLSAAHCFDGSPGKFDRAAPNDIVIVEGTNVLDRGTFGGGEGRGRKLRVSRIIVHERWNKSSMENDIALLELATSAASKPVPIFIAQASKSGEQDDLRAAATETAGAISIVTGWGTLRQGGSSPDRLMQVELPVVSVDTCRAAYAGDSTIDHRTLCAGLKEGGKDSCQGDSGGPMVARDPTRGFVQIGIVSWGKGCGLPSYYGVYTRVSTFNEWLRGKTGLAALGHSPVITQPGSGGPNQPASPVQPPRPQQATARGDRALLVGIDQYENPKLNLKGSLNDVHNMRRLLIDAYGYRPEQIMTLVDAQATRANIVQAFDDWLVRGSAPGARVFFFMSSHGSQVPDLDGDEEDGLDETLVPYDARVESQNGRTVVRNQIIDDEIDHRIKRIPDRKVTVLIDACHSGTVTRDLALAAESDPGSVKCLCAVLDDYEPAALVAADTNSQIRSVRSVGTKQGFVERNDNVVAWSAVNAGQLALVDKESQEPQGVFTRRFIEGIGQRRADQARDGTISHAKLLEYVRGRSEEYCSRHKGSCQAGLSPQLEARREILALDVLTGRPPSHPQDLAQNVLAHDNSAGVAVDFVQGSQLRVGQVAQFRVTTQKSGYLVLLDVTADGKVTQIFPNARSLSTPTGGRSRSNFITPDRPLMVPDPGNPYEGFEFVIDPPTGEGRLVAVLSKDPMRTVLVPEAPRTFQTFDLAVDFVSQLAVELRRERVVDGREQKRDWSVAIKPYRIQQ
jgi:secreted trypsin-like serine protease